ncbi:MAG: 5,10-methylenetetrahydrofolate reductase [Chloroflexi bacterium]|nr:5,10-methylenetetrahydrofolate reductase [Chloroflexota bacterium]|tara:strand:- start:3036 stop:3881 length:846 start_codon:yes stop_codon:yes gene_type:complete
MKKISKILSEKQTISFEFFAPKQLDAQEQLLQSIKEINLNKLSFISVTYSVSKNSGPTDLIVEKISNETLIPIMPHLTCITHSKNEIDEIINQYQKKSINNILALRGDIPETGQFGKKDFENALELVRYLRHNTKLDISVAAHPEGHPDAIDEKSDFLYQMQKIQASDFAITQFFFESSYYFDFMEKLYKQGNKNPVLPGIMPPTNPDALIRMAKINGSHLPKSIIEKLSSLKDKKAREDFAKETTLDLIERLISNGAPGIHLYTMNNVSLSEKILNEINL